jgi:hypothetical protein
VAVECALPGAQPAAFGERVALYEIAQRLIAGAVIARLAGFGALTPLALR